MRPSFRTLAAYKKSQELAQLVFELSKSFPPEEKFSLTDQIRKSSRSVCVNIGEAYRQTKYPKSYSSKLTIADGELTETQIWLDVAVNCKYATNEEVVSLNAIAEEAGNLVGYMLRNPGKFGIRGEE